MKRIFIPTDFSEHADKAIEYAFSHYGNGNGVDFIIAHFFPPPTDSNFLISIDDLVRKNYEQTAIDQVQKVMDSQDLQLQQVMVIARPGPLRQNLIGLANELGATMIIYPESGSAKLQLPPSMIRKSPIPVMTVIT